MLNDSCKNADENEVCYFRCNAGYIARVDYRFKGFRTGVLKCKNHQWNNKSPCKISFL